PPINLKPDVSRNLLFVLKEALNNITKHSGASATDVAFHFHSNKSYTFRIGDNGHGIDYHNMPAYHNGLSNIKKRVEEINARLEVKSEAGKGTTIEIDGNLS